MPGHKRGRYRLAEDVADHRRQMVSSLTTAWGQFGCSQPDRGRGGRSERPLLIIAQDERGQLPTACISQQPAQPHRKVIGDKYHTAIALAIQPIRYQTTANAQLAARSTHFTQLG